MQDAVLKAAQELQDSDAPGFPAGSLPLSRAAAIQREQKQLKAAAEYTSWDLDDDDEDEAGSADNTASDDGHYDADDADHDVTLRQRQAAAGLQGGAPRQLAGGSSARQLLGNGSSRWGLAQQQQRGYSHERRVPDLLEFLQCTTPPAAAAAGADDSAAGGAVTASLLGLRAAAAAAAGRDGSSSNSSSVKGLPLNLPLDRY